MSEKCFCHLNGFKVKDADAREEIEKLKAAEVVDSYARDRAETAGAAAAGTQAALEAHVAAEVVDSTARSSILSLSNEFNTHKAAEVVDSTARSTASTAQTTANEAKSAAGANANSITGHETRITALESSGGGVSFRKVTLAELKELLTVENLGKLVKVVGKKQSYADQFTGCTPISYNGYNYGIMICNVIISSPPNFGLNYLSIKNTSTETKGRLSFTASTSGITAITNNSSAVQINDSNFDFYIEQ